MARGSMKPKSHRERLQSLFGGMVVSQEPLRRATAQRQKALAADFRRQQQLRAEYDALTRKLYQPMLGAYAEDPGLARQMRSVQALNAAGFRRRLAPPPIPAHEPQIVADLGATVVPPYDFQEVLFTSTGSPPNASSANKATGAITSSVGWNNPGPSSASITVGVGIFFSPPTTCPGTLRIASSVGYTWDYTCYSAFAGAHSDGWIGIGVDRFTLNGLPDVTLVDQRIFLWSNDSSGLGGPSLPTGSNTGFPLSASCPVDNQHFYHLWVRCGGTVSSAGFGGWGWFGSEAGTRIFGTVPSIAWELV
jgi:hypothetical protein